MNTPTHHHQMRTNHRETSQATTKHKATISLLNTTLFGGGEMQPTSQPPTRCSLKFTLHYYGTLAHVM